MRQTLLVPLDGSALGEAALPWAACLARARDLAIVLAEVVEWLALPMGGMGQYLTPQAYDEIIELERTGAREYLDPIRRRLVAQGLRVETTVRDGEPVESLPDLAAERGAYALVVATHGHGGLARLLLGSVTDHVLHESTVPVLLVRAGGPAEPPAPSFNRLLVPLDGSPLGERALDVALEIAAPSTVLVLVRVVESVGRSGRAANGEIVEDEEATRATGAAEAYLAGVARRLGRDGRLVQTSIRRGTEWAGILAAARAAAADVIVMSTHGRTGPARWILGSVADQVVQHADRPIFLVSARALTARMTGAFTVRDVMARRPIVVHRELPNARA